MKKLLLTLITLILIVVIAAIIVPNFISTDTIKAQVTQQIEKTTGHKLIIKGQFHFRFFPVTGLEMYDVSLLGAPGSDDKIPLIHIKTLKVDVAALPLLRGGVEIKNLLLDTPQINLMVDAADNNNWHIAPVVGARPAPTSNTAAAAKAPPAFAINDLQLSNAKITNGSLTYLNLAENKKWAVDGLNLSATLNNIFSALSVDGTLNWNKKTVSLHLKSPDLSPLLYHNPLILEALVKTDLLTLTSKGQLLNNNFTGSAEMNSSSLRDALSWASMRPKSTSPSPLATTLSSQVECGPNYCNLTGASLTLDKNTAKGDVAVNLAGKTPALDLRLSTDMLDVTPFLPPAQKTSALIPLIIPDAQAASGAWSQQPIDFSALRAANVTAVINAGGIRARNIVIGKIVLTAHLQEGKLVASIPNADLYGGKANINFTIDGSQAIPAIEKRTSIRGVELEPLLKAADITSRFSGAADIDSEVSSQGKNEMEMVGNLQGHGSIKINNGVIRGIDLNQMAQNLPSAFTSGNSSDKQTSFSECSGTFTMAQGVITNKDLMMATTMMRIPGTGQVNLPLRTLNYRLTPQMMSAATKAATAKEGIAVPIIVEGSLDNPTYRPDLQGMVKNALQNPAQLKQQLKNSGLTKSNLKGLLSGIKNN